MKINEIFNKYYLPFARLLGSKSTYRKNHPDHFVIFNARIYNKQYYEKEKDKAIRDFFVGQKAEIWYGDLDFHTDMQNLWKIHLELGIPLIITSEMGNKILEIGDELDRQWIGHSQNEGNKKGITIKDIMDKKTK